MTRSQVKTILFILCVYDITIITCQQKLNVNYFVCPDNKVNIGIVYYHTIIKLPNNILIIFKDCQIFMNILTKNEHAIYLILSNQRCSKNYMLVVSTIDVEKWRCGRKSCTQLFFHLLILQQFSVSMSRFVTLLYEQFAYSYFNIYISPQSEANTLTTDKYWNVCLKCDR